jgi:hypothetical protein
LRVWEFQLAACPSRVDGDLSVRLKRGKLGPAVARADGTRAYRLSFGAGRALSLFVSSRTFMQVALKIGNRRTALFDECKHAS